jgi:hypothetical protein
VVEVRLGRVDGDDGHVAGAQHRVALPEQLLEVDIADIPRVMVARHDHELVALDPVDVLLGQRVLVLEAVRGEVAGDDDDVGPELVHLRDGAVEQVGQEELLPAMEVGQLRDRERAPVLGGHLSKSRRRAEEGL